MLSSFRIVLLTVLSSVPPSLHPAARALRQEVLQKQISPVSSSSSASDEEGGHSSGFPFRGRSGSNSPMCGRVSAVYEEPEEVENADEGESEDKTPSHRSRTMFIPVASLFASSAGRGEASTSPFAVQQSPFAARHEYTSNTSAQERENPSPSPEPTGRFRNGRVKGGALV